MSANTQVIEVDSSGALDEFIRFPLRLYKDDPHYVAPLIMERKAFLNPKKNPFYNGARVKLYLARRGNETVGRISACINFPHNEQHNEKAGFFGFLDTIEDESVAHALLKVALITLKKEGMNIFRGPASFSSNHEFGFLVEGFDSPPVIMMPYNRPYQPKFAESFGLQKAMDLFAYQLTSRVPLPERMVKLADRIAERTGVTIRSMNMKRFGDEVDTIRQLYNDAWEDNWGFVPLSEAEFRHMAADMKQIVDPDLALIAEVDGRPIGFALSLPDINVALKSLNGSLFPTGIFKLLWNTKVSNKVHGLRTLIMGLVPEYRRKGIDSLLYLRTYQIGTSKGYNKSELSWILETNELMRSAAKTLGADEYKRYRVYEMTM